MTKSSLATTVHAIRLHSYFIYTWFVFYNLSFFLSNRDTELACLPVDLLNTIKYKKPQVGRLYTECDMVFKPLPLQVVSRLIQLLGEKILGSYSRLSGATMPSVAGQSHH